MSGFEPQTSGIGINHSTNWATTIDKTDWPFLWTKLIHQRTALKMKLWNFFIPHFHLSGFYWVTKAQRSSPKPIECRSPSNSIKARFESTLSGVNGGAIRCQSCFTFTPQSLHQPVVEPQQEVTILKARFKHWYMFIWLGNSIPVLDRLGRSSLLCVRQMDKQHALVKKK